MRVGREERRLGDALRHRGLDPVPQLRVPNPDYEWGFYDIDLAVGRLAIEVYTWWDYPWNSERLWRRTENLAAASWVVAYLWLHNKAVFTDAAVDSLVECYEATAAGRCEPYRVYDHDGCLLYYGLYRDRALTVDVPRAPLPAPPPPPDLVQQQRPRRRVIGAGI